MTLQNAPPGLDYERDKRFSKVMVLLVLFVLYFFPLSRCVCVCGGVLQFRDFIHIASFCNLFPMLQSFKEMVAACLVKDPKKRPTSEKLFKHPFFKHAKSYEFLARTILDGLPPLGERFRMLKVCCFSDAIAGSFNSNHFVYVVANLLIMLYIVEKGVCCYILSFWLLM